VLRGELSGEFDTGGLRHRLIVGADYDEFSNTLVIDRGRPSPRGDFLGDGRAPSEVTPEEAGTFLLLDINDPVYGLNLDPAAGANTNRNEFLEGYGLYFQDQIDITDQLQIRIGGRYDDFEQQTGQDFQGNQFDPNITESVEAGFKAELGGLMDSAEGVLTVSVFQIDQSNYLVNDDRPEATAVGFFSIAAGEARSRGVEVDANLEFDGDISLWASYAFTDAEFRNEFADADGFGFTIETGDSLINTPKHQLSLQASKGFDLGLPKSAWPRIPRSGSTWIISLMRHSTQIPLPMFGCSRATPAVSA